MYAIRSYYALMLAAEGYPPVYLAGYLKDNQRDYYEALAGVQLKSKWSDWVRFFASGVEVAVQESIMTRITSYNVCYTKLLRSYGGGGADSYQTRDHEAVIKKVLADAGCAGTVEVDSGKITRVKGEEEIGVAGRDKTEQQRYR